MTHPASTPGIDTNFNVFSKEIGTGFEFVNLPYCYGSFDVRFTNGVTGAVFHYWGQGNGYFSNAGSDCDDSADIAYRVEFTVWDGYGADSYGIECTKPVFNFTCSGQGDAKEREIQVIVDDASVGEDFEMYTTTTIDGKEYNSDENWFWVWQVTLLDLTQT